MILSGEHTATLIELVSKAELPDTYKMGLINRLTEVWSHTDDK